RESRQAGAAVGGGLHLVALDLQVVAQAEGQIAIVFDHQDTFHRESSPCSFMSACAAVARGSSTTNFVPPRSPVSAEHLPPWRGTRSWSRESPMRVPARADRRSRSSL